MGHINFENLVKLKKTQAIRDMARISKPTDTICKPCQHGKQRRVSFKTKEYSTSKSLELVHIDLYEPTRTKNLKSESYFMLLIDYYTRMTWVTFLKEKTEAFENFKAFKSLVENETHLKIKCLKLDIGGEFTSYEFDEFYENHGIKRHFSATNTPQETKMIEEVMRSQLKEKGENCEKLEAEIVSLRKELEKTID
jgi:hypothetical protein